MKRIYVLSIFALLTLTTVSTTQAQTPTTREASSTPGIKRNEVMERVNKTLENVEDKIELNQEEREARREEFQTKLEEMKDIRKQAMIERVDEKISNFNEKHTTKLQNGLTRMQAVLDKVETRASSESAKGVDVDEVEAAVEEAQTAIDAAQEAITTQLEKEYVIDLTDETSIRSSAKELFTEFRTDLKAVHELVKDAHTAVVKAARTLPKSIVTSVEDNSSSDEADSVTPSEDTEEN